MYDCGVFTLVCADRIFANLPSLYSQNDISCLRQKIAADIIWGEFLYNVTDSTRRNALNDTSLR